MDVIQKVLRIGILSLAGLISASLLMAKASPLPAGVKVTCPHE